ncbi:MAG: hypothetical protein ACI8PT_001134 [Gammaproteobacteria bacterium]|jgi:hypothetical protein
MITLTDQQRTQWAIDGYLHLKSVIEPEEVQFLSAELDRIRGLPGYEPAPGELPRGHYKWSPGALDQDAEGFMDRRDLLGYGKPFIDLVDRPHVFDLIVDIMGPYILHSMSQAIVRASTDHFPGYTHTDGGEALRRIRVTETSLPLAMKAMYLLSDVEGPDSGNFTVFPGSHMRPFPENAEEYLNPHAPGAVQLGGKAGDCYLFAHSLWHGPAPNHSGAARKTLLYNYCQMFIRWYDHAFPADVLEQCTPRQRRLLGDLGYDFRPGSYFYAPTDQQEVIAAESSIA